MQRQRGSGPAHLASRGIYANYFEVGHTAFEFVIECGEHYSVGGGACHTRIVTTPPYAKALLDTLAKSVEEYTARFGTPEHP